MKAKRKVLLVSLGHPELISGGSPVVCQELFEGLRERGDIECHMLAGVDRESGDAHRAGGGVTGFDGRDGVYLAHQGEYDDLLHRNNDSRLIDDVTALLRALRPDVVHFHHFLHLGADLISLTRRILPSCRIVFTFHEFAAICAADGHMVRRTDGSLCTRASPLRCHQCLPARSPDDFMLREMWLKQHLRQVDHFVCPGAFMIERYVAWGIPRDRISHVANGQRPLVTRPLMPLPGPRDRFGYFGQLHDDKGVHVLLRAVTVLREQGFTRFRVDINGGGIRHASAPVREEIEAFRRAEEALPAGERLVFFHGPYSLEQIQSRMARVDWAVVPSVWWEIFGLVISEAWMFRRPVICSNVGGMAERVTHETDGLHFEMGDPAALAATMRRAATEEGLWEKLGAAIPAPPTRREMVEGYVKLYQAK